MISNDCNISPKEGKGRGGEQGEPIESQLQNDLATNY